MKGKGRVAQPTALRVADGPVYSLERSQAPRPKQGLLGWVCCASSWDPTRSLHRITSNKVSSSSSRPSDEPTLAAHSVEAPPPETLAPKVGYTRRPPWDFTLITPISLCLRRRHCSRFCDGRAFKDHHVSIEFHKQPATTATAIT